MKKIFVLILLSCFGHVNAQTIISGLTAEGLSNPIGIEQTNPVLSWIINSSDRNVKQSAYEIVVCENSFMKKNIVWNSGKVNSDQSVNITYEGTPLKSDKRYYWQVRIWDNNDKMSAWSQPAYWHSAFFNTTDWKASWIETQNDEQAGCPYLRTTFSSTKKLLSATAYITAHGLYEAFINGKKVGDAYLTPGWTSYNKRLQYQVYDVTDLIQNGKNCIGAILGDGWYKGAFNWNFQTNIYGDKLGLLCQINIKYTDGSTQTIVSDDSWKYQYSDILFSGIYNGETIDANKKNDGWETTAFNDTSWEKVKTAKYDMSNLITTYNQPITKHETFTADKIITTPKGEKVIDFGQNLVGWEKVKIKGNKGDTIKIYHAEVLDKDGNFYTDNLRLAKATSTYVLSGNDDLFEPHFTFYGFRYIKIEGIKGDISPNDFSAVALYSNMPLNGSFTSSNPLVNQLQKNIEWGQKGNFLDVPTDCPQRDERLGWTGDAQAFFRTAVFNRDGRNFFKKWMKDLAAEQYPDGRVPHVIPQILGEGDAASTGWSDAATIIPWQLYMAYADKDILKDQYSSMKAWIDYMSKNSVNNLWNTKPFHFGDWLFFSIENDVDGRSAITDKYLIAQCFFAHSTSMLINAATVLDKKEDIKYYTELLKNIKTAFMNEYVTPNGRLVSSSQTAYVLALHFDMLPEELRQQAAGRLAENIDRYGNHITTGFLGTPYICHALSRFGYKDIAYKLLLQETYPSWLYPVKAGATTIWERWDGIKTDGTFQTTTMNSFNHYAYGAIGDWLYRVAAGLQEDEAGYKSIIIKPHTGGGFTTMSAKQNTPYGKAESSWKIDGDKLIMDVVIPSNTTATIYIPSKSADNITESGRTITTSDDFKVVGSHGEYIVVKTGSGRYSFTSLNNN